MSEKLWRIYLVRPIDQSCVASEHAKVVFADVENQEIVKAVYEEFKDNCWWNYYSGTIRFGILTEMGVREKIIEIIEKLGFKDREVNWMINPDYEGYGISLAEDLNRIKQITASVVANVFGFKIPETELKPNTMAYIIHLMMNQFGLTYSEEHLITSFLCYNASNGMFKNDE